VSTFREEFLAAVMAERFPSADEVEAEFRMPVPQPKRHTSMRDRALWDDSELTTRMRRDVLKRMPFTADDLAGKGCRVRTLACRDGRHVECQGCIGCECHAGRAPADFRNAVRAAREAAEAERAAEVRDGFENAGEGS
jgi:hypothetical protein